MKPIIPAGVALTVALIFSGCGQQEKAAPEKTVQKSEAVEIKAEVKTEAVAVAHAEHGHEAEEGCIHEGAHKPEGESCEHGEAPKSDATGHFGAAFVLAESRPLASVLAEADKLGEDAVQVTGEIDQVCQKMGCWMVVRDGDKTARILMKDHSFTVPTESKGKPVVVEGTIAARTFNEAQVKHLEKDAGGDPAAVSGEREEFVLTASGVEIQAQNS
ncbi:MAG: DUF4920 domain-containing protein [Nannocystaceae bacterium]|nr:DUF4920 domain-containing protein [Myxococcales bacterium]